MRGTLALPIANRYRIAMGLRSDQYRMAIGPDLETVQTPYMHGLPRLLAEPHLYKLLPSHLS